MRRRSLESPILDDLKQKMVFIDGPRQVGKTTLAQEETSPHLRYFGDRLKIPLLYQVVLKTEKDFFDRNIRVLSAGKFLSALV